MASNICLALLHGVLKELLWTADGNELYIRPVAQYLAKGEELSFFELLKRGRQRRHMVLGYLDTNGTPVLNPEAKNKPQRWEEVAARGLIVLAEDDGCVEEPRSDSPEGLAEGVMLEGGMLGGGVAEGGSPEGRWEEGVAEGVVLEGFVLEEGAPVEAVLEGGLMEGGWLEGFELEGAVAEMGLLEAGVLEGRVAEEGVLEGRVAARGVLERGLAEGGVAERGLLEGGMLEEGRWAGSTGAKVSPDHSSGSEGSGVWVSGGGG